MKLFNSLSALFKPDLFTMFTFASGLKIWIEKFLCKKRTAY